MIIKSLVTTALLFTCSCLFAQDDIGRSVWASAPVKVDGNGQEWNPPLRYYDDNTRLFFAFTNDDKNLYLCFQTPDEMNQRKIMRAGMEITLITKSKHKASVSFPVAQPLEQPPPVANENSMQQKFNAANMRSAFITQHNMMDVKGFNTRNGLIPVNDGSGINAAINWDETNRLTYELAIPLTELFGAGYTTADILKDIFLDVKVNAAKQNGSVGSSGNGYSGRGGGRMRGGGGRMGGAGMNRTSGGEEENAEQRSEYRAAMFEKKELKEKFILAQNKTP